VGTAPGHRIRGSGIPVSDLRSDARILSVADFEERHGSAFLLLTAADLATPTGPATTEVRLALDDGAPADSTASLALVAFPIRRTGRAVGHLITVGRASNNDVAIPDLSISRFHAFLKPRTDGGWQLQDAGSTNGTTVNGRAVPQQGQGAPVDLSAGDDVRLGQVDLTFLPAEQLRAFALKIER
jgi:pSer/pThr/pTyr-binding forkhead associated (FHA) protein